MNFEGDLPVEDDQPENPMQSGSVDDAWEKTYSEMTQVDPALEQTGYQEGSDIPQGINIYGLNQEQWDSIKSLGENYETSLENIQKSDKDRTEEILIDKPYIGAYDMSPTHEENLITNKRSLTLSQRFKSITQHAHHQRKFEVDEGVPESETAAEAKSRFIPANPVKESKALRQTRDELAKAVEIPVGPLKDRLILSWSSFAHRISKKKEGSEDILEDVEQLFSKWYSGSAYFPFRHSREDEWIKAIDQYLPVEIIGSRSFIFSREDAPLAVRLRQGWDHYLETIEKALPFAKSDGSFNLDAIYDYTSRIMRSANDFATEFFIKPSRTTSAGMIAAYELMYRNATRQFYSLEEALAYKIEREKIRADMLKKNPNRPLDPMRPISAMYSDRSHWSPLRALGEFMLADVKPFIDLSEIKHGITAQPILSFPGKPTKNEFTPWREVFNLFGKYCDYVVVRGDPYEYRREKRELYRTLCGADTDLGRKIEHLVLNTSFKGKFVLEIDPLLSQIRGGKSLTLDRNQTFQFSQYISDLISEKSNKAK